MRGATAAMKMTTVTIKRGEHQSPLPPGTQRLLENQLASRGLIGSFTFTLGPNVKGTAHTPVFEALRVTDRHNVELKIKPGNNATCHIGWLVPEDATVTVEQLYQALSSIRPDGKEQQRAAVLLFSHDDRNVKAFLRVLVAEPERVGREAVVELYRQLDQLLGERGDRGWSRVVPAIARRGFIETKTGTSDYLIGIKITELGLRHIGRALPVHPAAPPGPAATEPMGPPRALPLPEPLGGRPAAMLTRPASASGLIEDDWLRQRLAELRAQEKEAISALIPVEAAIERQQSKVAEARQALASEEAVMRSYQGDQARMTEHIESVEKKIAAVLLLLGETT